MPNNIFTFSIGFLLLWCAIENTHAEAYRWKDGDGHWHFSDKSIAPNAEDISGQLTPRNMISASSNTIPDAVFSQGNNITRFVVQQDISTPIPLKTYIFQPPLLAKLALLDIVELRDFLYFSSHTGLIEFNRKSSQWFIYDKKNGLPGDSIEEIASDRNNLAIKVNELHRDGIYYPVGNFTFNITRQDFSPSSRSAIDVKSGGGYSNATDNTRLPTFTDAMEFDKKSWFASIASSEGPPGNIGGGIYVRIPLSAETTHYTTSDGLSHAYCYKMTVTPDKRVWVTHWEKDRGLSFLPYGKTQWQTVKISVNNIELGGTSLTALDNYLLIGQPGRLVMYDTQSKLAMVLDKAAGLAGYNIPSVLVASDAVWIISYSIALKGGYETSGLNRIEKQVLRDAFFRMHTQYDNEIADKKKKDSTPSRMDTTHPLQLFQTHRQ